MTRPAPLRFVDVLFPDGQPLYYEGTFKDKTFARHWTVLHRAPAESAGGGEDGGDTADTVELKFYLELDPRPLGQGGPVLKERCLLVLDRELVPLRYGSEAAGARVSLEVQDPDDEGTRKVKVRLPDTTEVEVDFGDSGYIVESNITGLDALFYAIAHQRGELEKPSSGHRLFLVNQIMAIPYTITRRDDGLFGTSHDEVLDIDERGLLRSTELAKASVRFERRDPPPLPYWADLPDGTRPPEVLRYLLPADATFTLQDVSIAGERGEVGGSLTIPEGDGPFPAVLFLGGTGTHDRHGIAGTMDIGSHEIVDHLGNHGFVGLRFDTRGAGTTKAGDSALDSSLAPLIADARVWYEYLKNRPEVDSSRITLLGHSQGGTVALITAGALAPDSIVLLATPGRTLHEILRDQIDDQGRKMALDDDQRAKNLADFQALIDNVRAGKRFEPGEVPDRLVPMARQIAWFKDHLDIDPAELVARLSCRLLICQGAKDFQVSVSDSERLAEAAGNAGVAVERMVFDDLDHLFKHCEGESRLEQYYDNSRRVSRDFLDQLLAWLDRGSRAP